MNAPDGSPAGGQVAGLYLKPDVPGEHGLPKRPVPAVRVGPRGVEGDFNHWREEHRQGDPAMALLLLPTETVDELRREGWPVRPGDLGENVATRGIRYAELAPPHRFRIGEATAESAKACDPCANLAALPYVGPEKTAAFLRTMLGRRGWYARVIDGGEIRVGDPIRRLA